MHNLGSPVSTLGGCRQPTAMSLRCKRLQGLGPCRTEKCEKAAYSRWLTMKARFSLSEGYEFDSQH